MFKLSQKSLTKMVGVHPDLVRVVKRAIQLTSVDFTVTQGLRTVAEQRELLKKGATTTMNSRHLTGHAVDLAAIVDGKIVWDWPLYSKLATAMKQAAKELKIPIEWGGDWKTFKDGPHFQLPFSKYPKDQKFSAEIDSSPVHAPETSTTANTKALVATTAGPTLAIPIATEPLSKAVDVLTSQQSELTSGDYVRIGLALVIVVASLWYAWGKVS